jgi:hypothetical protein
MHSRTLFERILVEFLPQKACLEGQAFHYGLFDYYRFRFYVIKHITMVQLFNFKEQTI